MGEGQILAQVKSVYQVGQACAGFGRHLNGLFKQAITAGKRVRAETSISSGAVSVSSAAAELAQLKLPSHDFADSKVCTRAPHHTIKLMASTMAHTILKEGNVMIFQDMACGCVLFADSACFSKLGTLQLADRP